MIERLAFVTMFTVMAAFVVGLAVLAAKTGARAGTGPPLVAVSARTNPVGFGESQLCPSSKDAVLGLAHEQRPAQPSGTLNARLAGALRQRLRTDMGQLSVGVIDPAAGTEALYHASQHYHAAGIASADVLAALLYQHQQAATPIGSTDTGLAAEMIGHGDRAAAGRLWQAIGRGAGLAAANRALRLQHTIPGKANAWADTRTTTADQLQLLTELATTRSALVPACQHYELGLLASVAVGQGWGAPAAASLRTSYAVTGGRQADPPRFVINNLSIIDHAGHELLVVVLSRNWPTRAAGRSAVRAATVAAVGAMLGLP